VRAEIAMIRSPFITTKPSSIKTGK